MSDAAPTPAQPDPELEKDIEPTPMCSKELLPDVLDKVLKRAMNRSGAGDVGETGHGEKENQPTSSTEQKVNGREEKKGTVKTKKHKHKPYKGSKVLELADMRRQLRAKLKSLREREVDFSRLEVEDKLFKTEKKYCVSLLKIEKALKRRGCIVEEEETGEQIEDFPTKIIITGTGYATLDDRITKRLSTMDLSATNEIWLARDDLANIVREQYEDDVKNGSTLKRVPAPGTEAFDNVVVAVCDVVLPKQKKIRMQLVAGDFCTIFGSDPGPAPELPPDAASQLTPSSQSRQLTLPQIVEELRTIPREEEPGEGDSVEDRGKGEKPEDEREGKEGDADVQECGDEVDEVEEGDEVEDEVEDEGEIEDEDEVEDEDRDEYDESEGEESSERSAEGQENVDSDNGYGDEYVDGDDSLISDLDGALTELKNENKDKAKTADETDEIEKNVAQKKVEDAKEEAATAKDIDFKGESNGVDGGSQQDTTQEDQTIKMERTGEMKEVKRDSGTSAAPPEPVVVVELDDDDDCIEVLEVIQGTKQEVQIQVDVAPSRSITPTERNLLVQDWLNNRCEERESRVDADISVVQLSDDEPDVPDVVQPGPSGGSERVSPMGSLPTTLSPVQPHQPFENGASAKKRKADDPSGDTRENGSKQARTGATVRRPAEAVFSDDDDDDSIIVLD